jgi:membrane-associated phospholipid phosphatase
MLSFIVPAAGQWWRPFLVGTAAVMVLGTAASRVYFGVQYPSDVVAAVMYSISTVALVDAAGGPALRVRVS